MTSNSSESLRVHLEGIHKAMLSLAQHLLADQEARKVCSHLEWSASHLRSAIRELGDQGDAQETDEFEDEDSKARAASSAEGMRAGLTEGLRGHTQAITIPEVLGFVSSLRKSGVLRVKTGDEAFLIQLDAGEVTFAKGDNPPVGHRLGEILCSRDFITPVDQQRALDAVKGNEGFLGDWLLAEGIITREQLVAGLCNQIQVIFYRVFQANDAVFQFDEGAQLKVPDDVRLNVTSLLLESARSSDEGLREAS